MGQLIIGLIVFAVIMFANAKKAKSGKGIPPHSGENFPLPVPQSVDKGYDEPVSAPVEETAKRRTPKAKNRTKSARVADEVNVFSYDAVAPQIQSDFQPYRSKTKSEVGEFEFDAEKAVIYSEIMRPKYDEY